jgi:hypothetical protein
MKADSEESYRLFEEAVRRLIHGLNIVNPEITNKKLETPKVGADYIAVVKGKVKSDYPFGEIPLIADLHLRIDTDTDSLTDWDSMRYILSIRNQIGIIHLDKFAFIRRADEHQLIWEWVGDAVREYNEKKVRDRLGFMFGNYPITGSVGEWDSAREFDAFLKGLIAVGDDDIVIYQMRHVEGDGFQQFSYALLFLQRWIIFSRLSGTGSGGASFDLDYINGAIEEARKSAKIHVVEFDVDYRDIVTKAKQFGAFLGEKSIAESVSDALATVELPEDIKERYQGEIKAINEASSEGEYTHALRDIRALIEASGKYLCRLNSIELPAMATRKQIVAALIPSVIEPRLSSWFDAFYALGNESSHNVSLDALRVTERRYIAQVSTLLGKTILLEILRKIEEKTPNRKRFLHPSELIPFLK